LPKDRQHPDRILPGSMATDTGGAAAMNGMKEDGTGAAPDVTGTKETGHKHPGAGNGTMGTGGNLLNR